MEQRRELITAVLPNGAEVGIVALRRGGAQDVGALGRLNLDGIRETLAGLAELTQDAIKKARPDSARVEFGLDIQLESGKLVALLVDGSGGASLTVTLSWGATD